VWGKRLHLHDGDNRVSGASGGCPSLLSMGASASSPERLCLDPEPPCSPQSHKLSVAAPVQ
jgi:hypothetical protein